MVKMPEAPKLSVKSDPFGTKLNAPPPDTVSKYAIRLLVDSVPVSLNNTQRVTVDPVNAVYVTSAASNAPPVVVFDDNAALVLTR